MLAQIFRLNPQPITDFSIKLVVQLILLCTLAPMKFEGQGMMPITLQTLVILFGGIAFGWRIGFLAALLYIGLGIAGLPVFAGYSAGARHIMGPYGGYFFGFLIATLLVGFLAETNIIVDAIHRFILSLVRKISGNPHNNQHSGWRAFSEQTTTLLLWVLGHAIILVCGLYWTFQMVHSDWREELHFLLPAATIKSAIGALITVLIQKIYQRILSKS